MRLNEAFPDWKSGYGIFDVLTSAPWYSSDTAFSLNLDYFGNHSGLKTCSPLVTSIVGTESALSENDRTALGRVLWVKYGYKWSGLWKAFYASSALSLPYGSTETTTQTGTNTLTMDFGKTVDRLESSTYTKTGTESDTTTGVETVTESYPEVSGVSGLITEKSVSGSYTDSGTGSNVRSGSQKVTDKGSTAVSTFGFNTVSADGVKSTLTGPNDTSGLTSETTYGDGTEGSGLIDESTDSTTRTYDQYKETTRSTGKREIETSYGPTGKKTEKSYANRSDAKTGAYSVEEGGRETHEWAPDLETVKTRAESPIEFLQRILSDQSGLGFFESVYRDIDEVLTLRVWQ